MYSLQSELAPILSILATVLNVAVAVVILIVILARNWKYFWLLLPLFAWMALIALGVKGAFAAASLHKADDLLPVARTLANTIVLFGVAWFLVTWRAKFTRKQSARYRKMEQDSARLRLVERENQTKDQVIERLNARLIEFEKGAEA